MMMMIFECKLFNWSPGNTVLSSPWQTLNVITGGAFSALPMLHFHTFSLNFPSRQPTLSTKCPQLQKKSTCGSNLVNYHHSPPPPASRDFALRIHYTSKRNIMAFDSQIWHVCSQIYVAYYELAGSRGAAVFERTLIVCDVTSVWDEEEEKEKVGGVEVGVGGATSLMMCK